MSRGREAGEEGAVPSPAKPSPHPQPPFCSTAAAQAGRAASATNASPTMAVATARAASPGNAPATRAGAASSVTKVSWGRERMQRGWERWARRGHQSCRPSDSVTALLAFPLSFKELGAFKDPNNWPQRRWWVILAQVLGTQGGWRSQEHDRLAAWRSHSNSSKAREEGCWAQFLFLPCSYLLTP